MSDPSLPEHEHSATIGEAARWLISTPSAQRKRPVIPLLVAMFGLTPAQACEACREAHAIRRAA